MGWYLARQRLAKREKFPLIVELEPLFQCNLACSGCGKIQHPEHVLRRRMSVEQAVGCGGGVRCSDGVDRRWRAADPPRDRRDRQGAGAGCKRFVYLCTNALLLEKKLDRFTPNPYFSWAIHIDGLLRAPRRVGGARGCVRQGCRRDSCRQAREGFRVTTNTTFFTHDSPLGACATCSTSSTTSSKWTR